MMILRIFPKLTIKAGIRSQAILYPGLTSLYSRNFTTKNSKPTDDTISFPRYDQGINSALNWALTKAYVTPFYKISHNAVTESSEDKNKTQIVTLQPNQFTDLNERIGATISNSETVYVIEGELEGLYVRIITGNEGQAKNAKGALNKVNDPEFKANITVLLDQDKELTGKTIVDANGERILSHSANKESLIEACKLIFSRW